MNAHHPKQTTTSTGLRRKTRWGGETNSVQKQEWGAGCGRQRAARSPRSLTTFVLATKPDLPLTLTVRFVLGGHSAEAAKLRRVCPPCFPSSSPSGGQWRSQTRGQTRPRKLFLPRIFDPTRSPNTPPSALAKQTPKKPHRIADASKTTSLTAWGWGPALPPGERLFDHMVTIVRLFGIDLLFYSIPSPSSARWLLGVLNMGC